MYRSILLILRYNTGYFLQKRPPEPSHNPNTTFTQVKKTPQPQKVPGTQQWSKYAEYVAWFRTNPVKMAELYGKPGNSKKENALF